VTRDSKHPNGPKIALAATVLAAPIVTAAPAAAQRATSSPGPARAAPRLRLILGPMLTNATSRYTVAGMIDGHTLMRTAGGETFYLDGKTGDMVDVH